MEAENVASYSLIRLDPENPIIPRHWFWAVFAVLFGVLYAYALASMWERWWKPTSYYTHAVLVPAIALVFVYKLRKGLCLTASPGRLASGLGYALLIGGLLYHLAFTWAGFDAIVGFSMIPVLVGWVLLFWGWAGLKRFWIPLTLLLFFVPMPMAFIEDLNLVLKLWAARASAGVLNAVQIPAVLDGSTIYLSGDKQIEVAPACSGLKYTMSLMLFGILYSRLCRARGYRKIILLLATVPIAIMANIVRVSAICVVADYKTVEMASGLFHDALGLPLFVVAFVFLFALERLLILLPPYEDNTLSASERRARRRGRKDPLAETSVVQSPFRWVGRARMGILLVLLGIGATFSAIACFGGVRKPGGALMPIVLEAVIKDAHCWKYRPQVMDAENQEKMESIFETTDIASGEFVFTGSGEQGTGSGERGLVGEVRPVSFLGFYSRNSVKALHRPEDCLFGSGARFKWSRVVEVPVPGAKGGKVLMRELLTEFGGRLEYDLYTFKAGQTFMPDLTRQKLAVVVFGMKNLLHWLGGLPVRLVGGDVEAGQAFVGVGTFRFSTFLSSQRQDELSAARSRTKEVAGLVLHRLITEVP